MKDSELRGLVLKTLYDQRRQDMATFDNLALEQLPSEALRGILRQLEQKGLIEWMSKPIGQLGRGRITAYGVDVVEGEAASPMAITIDQSITVQNSSSVQVGQGNIQNVTLDIEALTAAIDHSKVGEKDKVEAKSLLERALGNKVIRGVLEGWIKAKFGSG